MNLNPITMRYIQINIEEAEMLLDLWTAYTVLWMSLILTCWILTSKLIWVDVTNLELIPIYVCISTGCIISSKVKPFDVFTRAI